MSCSRITTWICAGFKNSCSLLFEQQCFNQNIREEMRRSAMNLVNTSRLCTFLGLAADSARNTRSQSNAMLSNTIAAISPVCPSKFAAALSTHISNYTCPAFGQGARFFHPELAEVVKAGLVARRSHMKTGRATPYKRLHLMILLPGRNWVRSKNNMLDRRVFQRIKSRQALEMLVLEFRECHPYLF